MYCAKQRARSPLLTALPATLHVGRSTLAASFASRASALIALGVMSGVPTIASCFRFECTVPRPLRPSTIAVIPKATRTMLAAMPPYSKNFRLSNIFATPFSPSLLDPVSADPSESPSGLGRRSTAAFPQRRFGIVTGLFTMLGDDDGTRVGAPPNAPRHWDCDQLGAVAQCRARAHRRSGRFAD